MCRIYGFRSSVLSGVHRSLVAAENALARQSERHPDGWGVAYYINSFPHVIRNDRKALEDGIFKEVSAVVATRTLLAHIRQGTVGGVSILNCHPFQHGPWTFAHNGEIIGFKDDVVRATTLELVDPRFRPHILGRTDSEICFYIFLSRLARLVDDVFHEGVRLKLAQEALRATVDAIRAAVPERDQAHRLTFVTTNGNILLGYRHQRELYFSTYKTQCPESDTCVAYDAGRCEKEVQDGMVRHLIVTSERIAAGPNVWRQIQDGDYVGVDHGMNFVRGVL